jgi:hypothetical protein
MPIHMSIHALPNTSTMQEAVFEEMGVETDKAVGADFEGAKALAQPLKKARTDLAPLRR